MGAKLRQEFSGRVVEKQKFDDFTISIIHFDSCLSNDWHFHDKTLICTVVIGSYRDVSTKHIQELTPGKIRCYQKGEAHQNIPIDLHSVVLIVELEDRFFNDQISRNNFTLDELVNLDLIQMYLDLITKRIMQPKDLVSKLRLAFQGQVSTEYDKRANEIKAVLNDRWNEFPSLAELSSVLKIHPVTISKYFSKAIGITISEYVRKIKIKRAVLVILNTEKTMAEIAFACGFSDQSHMIRLVKSYMGYTPGHIRVLSQENQSRFKHLLQENYNN
ncbi:helix-turn-helix domain-containing protein [Roseivirga misakiensis]|uniref:HTH araC/xylS-type domain-containing protein n=1 Tax=Roseivirga misakiensis TaxID=1563681 RepID=A0A1E5SZR9_9BACT|nr:AraC family transcriptional regulator [Roseivirga misakiensis]OEK04605.1 hypothetical protein BFP71_14185 [Roseivirga misakiensis]